MHSVDYEEQVIAKMQEGRPADVVDSLQYLVGDCTKLDTNGFPDNFYDVAVDKGTFDAIAVNAEEATVTMCRDYFNEMIRVLTPKGSLLIVSLLQPHVLKILLDFFIGECPDNKHRETNLFQVKL